MLIQLQPAQISLMWEEIKHSVLSTNDAGGRDETFAAHVLGNLLSGKFQCWVVCDSVEDVGADRKIHAIGLTTLIKDNLFGFKKLHILSLYGYRLLNNELAVSDIKMLRDFARRNKCDKITFETSVPRIEELADLVGFTKHSSNYSLTV